MTYIEGFVTAVLTDKKEEYRQHAADAAPIFKEFGVTRMVENWGDDLPEGEVTDYKRAVKAKDDEAVVYSYVEWPNKPTRDAAWATSMADESMKGQPMPFDGQRSFWGGFQPMLDTEGE